MAREDDPPIPGDDHGDPGISLRQQIIDLYQNLLRRTPSEAEIQSQLGNPLGIDGVRQVMLTSEEYSRLMGSQPPGTKTPPPTPPPTTPPPPTGPTTPPTVPKPPVDPGKPNPIPDWIPPTPTFNAPAPGKPPPFAFPYFKPPTGTDVWDDPSYQFRFGEGFHGLENSKAAMGTIGTGGSIKDFINYGQNFASNEFQHLYDRNLQTYGINRSNALDTYNTNYGTQYKDPFLFAYQNAQGKYGADALGYTTQVNAGLQNQQLGFNRDVLNYNITRNNRLDSFDEWYRKFLLQLQATQLA